MQIRKLALILCILLLALPHKANGQAQREPLPMAQAVTDWLRTDGEYARHPALRSFALELTSKAIQTVQSPDARLMHLLRDVHALTGPDLPYLRLTREEVHGFLAACAQDRLTMLRAIGLIARLIRRANVVLLVDGGDVTGGLEALHLSDGLSLPSEEVAYYIYIPDQNMPEPFQSRFLVLYQKSFRHTYPRDLIPSTVTIGEEAGTQLGTRTVLTGTPAWPQLYMLSCELRYDAETVGLFEVRGLGLAGFKSWLGGVAAMYAQHGMLILGSTRFHQQQRVAKFEAAENAGRFAVHGR